MMHTQETETFVQTNWLINESSLAEADLCLRTAGQFQSLGNFRWHQYTPAICVHVFQEGTGRITCSGRHYPKPKTFSISPNDMFIFLPGNTYSYWDCDPWRYTWFRLAGRSAQQIVDMSGLNGETAFSPASINRDITSPFGDILTTLFSGDYSALYPISAAWRIMDRLCMRHQLELGETAPLAEQIKGYIDTCSHLFPTVDHLAETFKLNRSTLLRHFTTAYGLSIKSYIDDRRFRQACQMLKQPDCSVKEIATACGFDDAVYFSRAFRKRYGQPPTQWRDASCPSKLSISKMTESD